MNANLATLISTHAVVLCCLLLSIFSLVLDLIEFTKHVKSACASGLFNDSMKVFLKLLHVRLLVIANLIVYSVLKSSNMAIFASLFDPVKAFLGILREFTSALNQLATENQTGIICILSVGRNCCLKFSFS